MSPADFRQLAEAAFAPLAQRYGLSTVSSGPDRLELASNAAKLSVARERSDLFIELGSTESHPLHRTTLSLSELIACNAPSGASADTDHARPAQSQRGQLQAAAALLERHGARELRGDFSIRPRLLRHRALVWLERKYHDLVEAGPSPDLHRGLAQVKWEYARQLRDEQAAVSQALERWLESGDARRRAFAELVVLAL